MKELKPGSTIRFNRDIEGDVVIFARKGDTAKIVHYCGPVTTTNSDRYRVERGLVDGTFYVETFEFEEIPEWMASIPDPSKELGVINGQ